MDTLHGTPWLLRDDPVDSIFKGAQIGSQIYRNQQDNRERKSMEEYRRAQIEKMQQEQAINAAEEARQFAGMQAYQAEAAEAIKANPGKSPDELLPPIFLKHVQNIVPRSAVPSAFNNARTQGVRLEQIQSVFDSKEADRISKEGINADKINARFDALDLAIKSKEGIADKNRTSREGMASKDLELKAELGRAKVDRDEKKDANAPELLALKTALYANSILPGLSAEDREAKKNQLLAEYNDFKETDERPKALTKEQTAAKEALGKLQEDRLKIMKEILKGEKKFGPDADWNPAKSYQKQLDEIDKNMAEANKILQGSDAAPVAATIAPDGLLGDILGSVPPGDRAPTARDSNMIPAFPEDIFGPPDAVTEKPAAVKTTAPVKVKSKAERDKLPKGTQYIGPDGKVYIRQ